MSLALEIQRGQGAPLYKQIADQIKDQICSRRLPNGARLPTIRQLAHELGVTRVTVQNAYDELQAAGWIEATIGRGTFVSDNIQAQRLPQAFGQPVTLDNVIGDILQVNEMVGVRSLASASPDPALFPADEFWGGLAQLRQDAPTMVSYGSSQGVPALRIELAALLHERQIDVTPDEILVTAGVTQGLALVTQALCRPGDVVLVEQPTYLGFLHTLKAQGVQPIGVPLDGDGLQVDVLERMAEHYRPRFLYTIPTFQNPTGICASKARRRAILAVAQRYGFLIAEDDLYARMAYDEPPPPPLYVEDESQSVIYLSSFSKMLMPGLRLGYLVAPPTLSPRLLSLRRAQDLCSPTLLQHALAHFLAAGGLRKHLRRVLPFYRERRDVFLAAMQHYMPPRVNWTRPSGGFCSWLTLPRQHGLDNLYQRALQTGWVFAPGDVFLAEPSADHHLRVCFGNQPPATIRTGVAALSQLIRDVLNATPRPTRAPTDSQPLV